MGSDDQNKTKPAVFIGVDNTKHNRAEPVYAWFVGKSESKSTPNQKPATPVALSQPNNSHSNMTELVSQMQSVKTDTPEAKLNKSTMDDNNGGRITFNDDFLTSKTFKGVEDPNRLPNKKS